MSDNTDATVEMLDDPEWREHLWEALRQAEAGEGRPWREVREELA